MAGESSSGWEAGRGKPTGKRLLGKAFAEEASLTGAPTNAPFPLREPIDTLARGKVRVGLL